MLEANPTPSSADMAEVRVLVPTEQIPDFYKLVGEWLRNPTGNGQSGGARRRRSPGRRRSTGGSKYEPIGRHLAGVDKDTTTLTFDEIQDLIGTELPASARKHRAWWANTETHSQALTRISNGWLVQEADLEEGTVTFRRG